MNLYTVGAECKHFPTSHSLTCVELIVSLQESLSLNDENDIGNYNIKTEDFFIISILSILIFSMTLEEG